MSGRTVPRVFGLPQTHTIEHAGAEGDEHLDFLVWALSFLVGMRLTTTEAGFLDATPAKPGSLVDFVLRGQSLSKGMELAERFWTNNRHEPRNAQRFAAAIHALFLGQNPQALQFEEFIYLYTAIDACYRLAAEFRQPSKKKSHAERIGWMCAEFGLATPDWAKPSASGGIQAAAIRNDALHEALYVDAPLGFAVHGGGSFGKPAAGDGRARMSIAGRADWRKGPVLHRIVGGYATEARPQSELVPMVRRSIAVEALMTAR